MTTKTKTAYVLLWITGEQVNTLCYWPPSGPEVRTYFEGHLDPRAGDESSFPRFDRTDDAVMWMIQNRGQKALVSVDAAKPIYGKNEKYGEPV